LKDRPSGWRFYHFLKHGLYIRYSLSQGLSSLWLQLLLVVKQCCSVKVCTTNLFTDLSEGFSRGFFCV
jgi:hypothetical protein